MTDVKAIWQRQTMEEKDMITLSEIRERAHKLRSGAHWRNLALYLWSAFNIVAGLWLILSGRLADYRYPMLLMIAAHLLVLWQVKSRLSSRPLPAELGARTALENYRRELERQRHALDNAWLWYIAPFMPALIWELGIRAMTPLAHIPPQTNFRLVLFIVLGAIFFWTAVWLAFSRAALKLQLQIERLKFVEAE